MAHIDPNEIVSPQTNPDGSVTLRLYAPNAEAVSLTAESASLSGRERWPMETDPDGVWSATLRGMRPDTYSYHFDKDFLIEYNESFAQFLRAHGIRHTYAAVDYEPFWPGRLGDHVWPVWRFDLRDFASLLFK